MTVPSDSICNEEINKKLDKLLEKLGKLEKRIKRIEGRLWSRDMTYSPDMADQFAPPRH